MRCRADGLFVVRSAMLRNQDKEVFLATTALEEFWDTEKPMVFLGQWCLLYGRKSSWQGLDGELMSGPFSENGAARVAFEQVAEIYEQILPIVAREMNVLHVTQHPLRYWRIVLGPWLHVYLSVIYDRYMHVRRAVNNYPKFSTLLLAKQVHTVASNTQDFIQCLHSDVFNLQIFSKIFSALGFDFPTKGHELEPRPTSDFARSSWKRRAVRQVTKTYASVAARLTRSVVLKDSYFPKRVEVNLFLSSIGRVTPVWGPSNPLPDLPLREVMRQCLRSIDLGGDEFAKCVSSMLFSDMPKCFIEGYERLRGAARRDYPNRTSAIFSANAWYYDEVFKEWAGACAEHGTRLLGTQHGGNYGALACMPSEDHETKIVDEYYSWGWERSGTEAKVIPMPASKLFGRERMLADNRKNGILWVSTMWPRYLVQFPAIPNHFEDYLQWQGRFASALSETSLAVTRLRPHREDNGWDLVTRLRDRFPGLSIESWDIPFQESIGNCRLYVCDHLSTTFIEALATNTPTLLFWDARATELRLEAQQYYDLLREHGILFDSPESAADAANRIYHDVESWWNRPELQRALATFCSRFARTCADAKSVWDAELRRGVMPKKAVA
jgi:putative transferase (TIGR04331 family)